MHQDNFFPEHLWFWAQLMGGGLLRATDVVSHPPGSFSTKWSPIWEKINRQQTSHNIPATPLAYMFRPDLSLTSLVSNYRKQCSSKSNKVSLLQYLHSAQRLRRISFQGNCLFFHVAVNSLHLFSPKLKQNSCIGHPKVVRNKHRLIVFSEINYFNNWLLSFERIDCYDKKKFKAGQKYPHVILIYTKIVSS